MTAAAAAVETTAESGNINTKKRHRDYTLVPYICQKILWAAYKFFLSIIYFSSLYYLYFVVFMRFLPIKKPEIFDYDYFIIFLLFLSKNQKKNR